MRTTFDLPDSLFKRMKATAALRGMKMRELVTEILEQALGSSRYPGASKGRREVKLPLIHRKKPGTIQYSNQQLEELMVAEEAAKFEKSSRR